MDTPGPKNHKKDALARKQPSDVTERRLAVRVKLALQDHVTARFALGVTAGLALAAFGEHELAKLVLMALFCGGVAAVAPPRD